MRLFAQTEAQVVVKELQSSLTACSATCPTFKKIIKYKDFLQTSQTLHRAAHQLNLPDGLFHPLNKQHVQ